MRGVLKGVAVVVLTVLAFGLGWLAAWSGVGRAVDPASLTDLEQAFTDRMQNVALVGHFTFEGPDPRDGNPERYEIARVTKVGDHEWRFDVRITYLSVDVTLPVTVPIVWAGDTPMVSITDVSIPGLGDQFTARVFFYKNRYAGSWDHGSYGGLMYGTIEPMSGN